MFDRQRGRVDGKTDEGGIFDREGADLAGRPEPVGLGRRRVFREALFAVAGKNDVGRQIGVDGDRAIERWVAHGEPTNGGGAGLADDGGVAEFQRFAGDDFGILERGFDVEAGAGKNDAVEVCAFFGYERVIGDRGEAAAKIEEGGERGGRSERVEGGDEGVGV